MDFRISFNGRPHAYTQTEIDTVVDVMRESTPLTQGVYLRNFEKGFQQYARADHAEALYQQILAEHSGSYFAEHSRYFLGVLYFQLNEQPDEAAAQLEIFIREYPDSAWIRLAHDTLGI